jgi:molybdenum cofactor synthesis domain-containing protein
MDNGSDGAKKHVELFAIGTELVMGRIYDTNSFWIAEQLAKLGAWPRRITCLPDDDDAVVEAFADSINRGTRVIITTGGLGPTPDDRTLDCVCRLLGLDQETHRPTVESFKRRRNLAADSELSPSLLKMATVPVGATVYQNPAGWAPLIQMDAGPATFYMMPGPPKEMQAIWNEHLNKLLAELFQSTTAAQRVWVTMFESEVSPHLQAVMQKHPQTYVKAYVALRTDTTLPVDLVAHGPSDDEARATLEAAIALLTDLVRGKGKEIHLAEPEGT